MPSVATSHNVTERAHKLHIPTGPSRHHKHWLNYQVNKDHFTDNHWVSFTEFKNHY